MKVFFYTLITCIAVLSQSVMAAIPVVPSADAGAGAKWYRIKNLRASRVGVPVYLEAPAVGEEVLMADFTNTDNFLWCFVGTEAAGFQIYNKAFPSAGTRLVFDADGHDGWGTAKLATSGTEWNYVWKFVPGTGSEYGLTTTDATKNVKGESRGKELLHGMDYYVTGPNVIFYGILPSTDGNASAWAFEDANTSVTVDLSALKTLINEYTIQVNVHKGNPANVAKYGKGIEIFEEAIAAAQDVVDDPGATQSKVNAAIATLRKANYNYGLAFKDLPFDVSAGNNRIWYKIKNYRLGANGYLTNNDGKIIATAATTGDNQLWAFEGDNFTGVDIYNKANSNAKLIAVENIPAVSAASWDGIWKLDWKISDATFYYGIANVNGSYTAAYEASDFIYTATDGSELAFSGFGDNTGSWYVFELFGSSSIKEVSNDAILVYARDGKIYVDGTESKVILFSATGGLITVFDAQNPFAAAKGVYIVRVNDKVHKVVVQ